MDIILISYCTGIERNVTLNSLLFSCLLGREYAEMKRIFWEFPRKYGLEPNLETYNTILKRLCNSGGAKEVHFILAEMDRKSFRPNGTTFATVIAGFYSEGNMIDVGKMLCLMKKYNLRVGISIYNVRIHGLCKLGRLGEAKALFDGILSNRMKPNCQTYGHLIYGFFRHGRLDTTKNLFVEMVERGLKSESECYFTLVYYLCQGKDFEAAFSICEDCMSNGWVPNVTAMKSLVPSTRSTTPNELFNSSRIDSVGIPRYGLKLKRHCQNSDGSIYCNLFLCSFEASWNKILIEIRRKVSFDDIVKSLDDLRYLKCF